MKRVTKILKQISMGHRLPNHPGKCKFLHGHNYSFAVSAEGKLDPDSGMIVDFAELKAMYDVIDKYDHKTMLYRDDPLVGILVNNGFKDSVCVVNFVPTVENIALHVLNQMRERFDGKHVRIERLEVSETDTSRVIVT